MRLVARFASLWLLLTLVACGSPRDRPGRSQAAVGGTARLGDPGTGASVNGPPAAPREAEPSAAATPGAPLVVFLGDSLSAGLGLDADQAYPALAGKLLDDRGLPVRVLNAGLSGDTSAGGRERLAWFLRQKPAVVVVELGANDALRGQPLAGIEANLRDIVERAQSSGARVVLAGMQIPTNYGPDYTRGFAAIYPRVARQTGATLIPFLLEEVGGIPRLNQADGIHPTAEGQRIVARNVVRVLAPVVSEVEPPGRSATPGR